MYGICLYGECFINMYRPTVFLYFELVSLKSFLITFLSQIVFNMYHMFYLNYSWH